MKDDDIIKLFFERSEDALTETKGIFTAPIFNSTEIVDNGGSTEKEKTSHPGRSQGNLGHISLDVIR